MLRLNRIALVIAALLSPFAASGLVIVVAEWIEAITGYDFADKPVAVLSAVAVLSVLVSIGAAIAAFCAVLALWDET